MSFHRLAIALLLCSAATTLGAQTHTITAAKLRSSPSASGAVVATVPGGAVVRRAKCTNAWCWVTYGRHSGFVADSVLSDDSELRSFQDSMVADSASIGSGGKTRHR